MNAMPVPGWTVPILRVAQVLCAAILLLVLSRPSFAQQPPDINAPPANPNPQQSTSGSPPQAGTGATQAGSQAPQQTTPQTPPQSTNQNPPSEYVTVADETLGVLTRRSIFFPDLATNRKPLSSTQKFKLFVDQTIAPSTFVSAAVVSAWRLSVDSYPGYGQELGGYGKRYGAAMANSASTNFLGTFVVPSLLHQDPRYFVTLRPGFWRKFSYALTRQVVTRTDDGHKAFNWSRVIAVLGSESLANTYLPPEERTVDKTLERSGLRFCSGVAISLLKEYWPIIFKNLGLSAVYPEGQPDQP
jgi:hypothetical protein